MVLGTKNCSLVEAEKGRKLEGDFVSGSQADGTHVTRSLVDLVRLDPSVGENEKWSMEEDAIMVTTIPCKIGKVARRNMFPLGPIPKRDQAPRVSMVVA